eukprot:501695-Rhodomonas_salina.2
MQSVGCELPTGDPLLLEHEGVEFPPGHHVSALHNAQLPPFGPKKPAVHVQFSGTELPEGEEELDGQDTLAPLTQKKPLGQVLHVPPSGPEYPATQIQSVRFLLPLADDVSAGHGSHMVADDWSVQVPASHSTHASEPITDLYVPALHDSHS